MKNEVYTKLIAIFQNVNEWLKFAEAKNAVLLAFSGAGVTATITLLATVQNLPNSLSVGLLITTSLLCICALLCSYSFFPKTDLERILSKNKRTSENPNLKKTYKDNLYYFGDLQKYSSTELLNALNIFYFQGKLGSSDINPRYDREWEDLATQITVNAKITCRKLKLFSYALLALIVAILAIPISMLFSFIVCRSV